MLKIIIIAVKICCQMKILSEILGWIAVLNLVFSVLCMKGLLPDEFLLYSIGYFFAHYFYCGIREEGIFSQKN